MSIEPEVPRRLPPTVEEQVRVVAERAVSDRGRTRWTRPVTARTPTPVTAPTTTAAPIGSALFFDNGGGTSVDYFLNCSTPGATFGDASAMSYDASGGGSPAIRLDAVGWYVAQSSIILSGSFGVEDLALILEPAGSSNPSVIGHMPATGSAYGDMGIATIPFYVPSVPDWIFAEIRNPSGTGTIFGNIYVVHLA